MAKSKDQQAQQAAETQLVKVLYFYEGDAGGSFARAYGFREYEIPLEIIEKHGTLLEKPEPDLFAIFMHNLTKKARNIFGI